MKATKILLTVFLLIGFGYTAQLDSDEGESQEPNHNAEKLAESFKISSDSVNFLKREFKIGYGGVSKALAMARQGEESHGLSAEEILTMKTEGKMGWGQIAKKLDLKPGKDWKTPAPEPTMQDPQDVKTEKLQKKTANLDKEKAKADKIQSKAERKEAKAQAKADKREAKAQAKAERKANKNNK